jgi:hypothetical protein
MTRIALPTVMAGALLLASCAEELPPRSYVQTNVVDKSLFQGEWYYSWTVIDNRYTGTATDTLSTFVGDTSMDFGAGWTVARIRWVIDEDFLYAFRSHELVRGSNPDAEIGNWDTDGDGEPDGYRGEPVAAFAIESHFDIQRSYNPTTGEEYNIIEENSQDRRWYERRYMRVDWSMNHIVGYNVGILDIYALPGLLNLATWEPSPMFVQPGSDMPESWRPVFEFTAAERPCAEGANVPTECSYDDEYRSRYFDDYGPNQFFFMSFVTQEMLTPGSVPDPYTGESVLFCQSIYSDSPYCTSNIVTKRHSFLRVGENHDYAPALHEDNDFDRFGLFRIERPTNDRVDPHDPADPRLGRTDFLDYYSVLHTMWQRYHDDEGNVLPYSQREPRRINVWLTAGYPAYLTRTALGIGGEWGETFMRTVRGNRGIAVPDPYYRDFSCETNEQCLEQFGPDSGWRSTCDQSVNQCRRPYNPLRTPSSPYFYEGDYDCYIAGPDGQYMNDPMGRTSHDPDNPMPPAERESDFESELQLRFHGSECMVVTHVNSCDRDPTLPCEERGDMRYRFFSFVFSADTPFLGVATMRGDPITGEMVGGDANFATWDMGWYRTRALQEYDILTGNLTEEQLMTGEDVRGMINDLGRVIPPVRPLRTEQLEDEGRIALPAGFTREGIDARWNRAFARAERLRGDEGRRAIYSDRVFNLRGTDIERSLFDNPDMLLMAGVQQITPEMLEQPVPESILDAASPFRIRMTDLTEMMERRELRRALYGQCFGVSSFTDYSVLRFVEDHLDYTRPQLTFTLDRHVLSETVLHEYGHVIGLRHNFTGTVDAHNYHPEYYEIVRNHPLPGCTDQDLMAGTCSGPDPRAMEETMNYDQDGDRTLSREETAFLTRAQANVRRERELDGIEYYMTSSLMDYTPSWYHRLVGLGRYDVAAILFNYGRLFEVYDNRGDSGLPVDQLNSADGRRELWRFYSGGESCRTDADCPYGPGGELEFDLTAVQRETAVRQRCLPNERFPGGQRYCSNTYQDLDEVNSSGDIDWVAVRYRFCADDRVGDQSDCLRMDEGASYQEIVLNARENYHRQYFWNNFRRFRHNFSPADYMYRVYDRIMMNVLGIYHHMYYRWATEGDAYRNNTGPLGFYDQFLASVDVMNFMAEIMAQPNPGVYWEWEYTSHGREYQMFGENLDEAYWDDYFSRYGLSARDVLSFWIYPGQGKYWRSDYRQGITGINYIERLGVIYDKFWAMYGLSDRWTGMPYTVDEPYFVNFYDAFPEEMSFLFGHYASLQTSRVQPRVTVDENDLPTIEYMDLWMGDCEFREGVECRPEPDDAFGSMPPLNDWGSWLMEYTTLRESLAQFPVYWDATWERQLHVYSVGGVDGIEIHDCADEPDNIDCLVEGVDYVRFTSARFHRSYVAFAMEPDADGHRGESYMFNLLQEANRVTDGTVEIEDCMQTCACDDICVCMDACDGDEACIEECNGNPDWDLETHEDCVSDCGGDYDQYAESCPNCGYTSVDERDVWLRELGNRADEIEGYVRYVLQIQREYGLDTWMGY